MRKTLRYLSLFVLLFLNCHHISLFTCIGADSQSGIIHERIADRCRQWTSSYRTLPELSTTPMWSIGLINCKLAPYRRDAWSAYKFRQPCNFLMQARDAETSVSIQCISWASNDDIVSGSICIYGLSQSLRLWSSSFFLHLTSRSATHLTYRPDSLRPESNNVSRYSYCGSKVVNVSFILQGKLKLNRAVVFTICYVKYLVKYIDRKSLFEMDCPATALNTSFIQYYLPLNDTQLTLLIALSFNMIIE